MSSVGKTAIGLNQWQLQEKPLMSDFNADNDIVTKYLLTLSGSGLLINSNFSVWQRAPSYTVTSTANYGGPDRWKFKQVSGAPVISQLTATSGLKCTGGSCTMMYLMDTYDLANVSGQVCTLSYKLNGAIKTTQFTPSSQTVVSLTLANGDSLEWVKLERGDQATEYKQPNYTDNLNQCERYCFISQSNKLGMVSSSDNYAQFSYELPNMRISPTARYLGTLRYGTVYTPTGANYTANGFSTIYADSKTAVVKVLSENTMKAEQPLYFGLACMFDAEL